MDQVWDSLQLLIFKKHNGHKVHIDIHFSILVFKFLWMLILFPNKTSVYGLTFGEFFCDVEVVFMPQPILFNCALLCTTWNPPFYNLYTKYRTSLWNQVEWNIWEKLHSVFKIRLNVNHCFTTCWQCSPKQVTLPLWIPGSYL